MNPDPQTGRLIAALLDDPDQPDGEVTAPDGRVYHKQSSPAPGVRVALDVSAAGQPRERVLTLFDPQPARPADYPADLPFVPGTAAMLTHSIRTNPPTVTVAWTGLDDPDGFERTLVEMSVADGWTVSNEPKQLFPGLAMPRELRRGNERQLVSRMPSGGEQGGHVMLLQS